MFKSKVKPEPQALKVTPELYSDIYTIVGGWLLTEKKIAERVGDSTAIRHRNLEHFLNFNFAYLLTPKVSAELEEFVTSKEDASRIQRLVTIDTTIRQRHGNALIDVFVKETMEAIAITAKLDRIKLKALFDKYPWIYLFSVAQYVEYLQWIGTLNNLVPKSQ